MDCPLHLVKLLCTIIPHSHTKKYGTHDILNAHHTMLNYMLDT